MVAKPKKYDPEKEQRKIEATKLRHYACSNITLLASGGQIPLGDIPNWLSAINQARRLDDIHMIWLSTETVLKMKVPDIETEADHDIYKQGLRQLVRLTLEEQKLKHERTPGEAAVSG